MTDRYVDQTYAKSAGYSQDISQIIAAGVCPFCPDYFPGLWHTNPILRREAGWLITPNMYPYPGTQRHLLIVGRRHIERLEDLQSEEFGHILALAQWAAVELHLPGGLLALRFGDTRFTGATVKHLHAHLVVPSLTDGKVAVVNFPVG